MFEYIMSWFYPVNQKNHLEEVLSQCKGEHKIYLKKNNLYFDIIPSNAENVFSVPLDMHKIKINNNLANIEKVYYENSDFISPTFEGNQPIIMWVDQLFMYFLH